MNYTIFCSPRRKTQQWSAFLFLLVFLVTFQSVKAAPEVRPLQDQPTPADLIHAVNALRQENGLPALNSHPSLNQVAQMQADGIAAGAPGHWRPPGLTLGGWMISLGYPLAGSIPMDGLRSENWTGGSEMTVDQAIQSWLGDAPHTNTMLSADRSDIGAGVAVSKDASGKTRYIYVIETALQTHDGKQQPEALILLTELANPDSQDTLNATQGAEAVLVPQYMVPVTVATARPDGDVVHDVQYGQTLWSIASEYGVAIDEIKRLNNLSSNDVWTNQSLLVQKGATQPAETKTPAPINTPESTPLPTATTHSTLPVVTPTLKVETESADQTQPSNITLILFTFTGTFVFVSLYLLVYNEHRSKDKKKTSK